LLKTERSHIEPDFAVLRPYNVRALRGVDQPLDVDKFLTNSFIKEAVIRDKMHYDPFEPLNLQQVKASELNRYKFVIAEAGKLNKEELSNLTQLKVMGVVLIYGADSWTNDVAITGIKSIEKGVPRKAALSESTIQVQVSDRYTLDSSVDVIETADGSPVVWQKDKLIFVSCVSEDDALASKLIEMVFGNVYPKGTTRKANMDFESRKQLLLDSIANWANTLDLEGFKKSDEFDGGKYGAYPIMALFEKGQIEKARQFAAQQLVGGAAMFREYTTMALYMQYHELYGQALRDKVKQDQMKSNFFNFSSTDDSVDVSQSHRNNKLGGASENHKLMYASAAYLAGIAWPDDYPKEWYQVGYDHSDELV
jgi:hypothetical protein